LGRKKKSKLKAIDYETIFYKAIKPVLKKEAGRLRIPLHVLSQALRTIGDMEALQFARKNRAVIVKGLRERYGTITSFQSRTSKVHAADMDLTKDYARAVEVLKKMLPSPEQPEVEVSAVLPQEVEVQEASA